VAGTSLPSILSPEEESLAQRLAGSEEGIRGQLERGLAARGEEALPFLLKLAAREDDRVQASSARILRGMAEDGRVLPDRALVEALGTIVARDQEGAEEAEEALLALGKTRFRDGVEPLAELLGHPDSGVKAAARAALRSLAHKDLGPDPGPWIQWGVGERGKYLERKDPRIPPPVAGGEVEALSNWALVQGQKFILKGADLERGDPQGRIPRGNRWRATISLSVDEGLWPWGVFPARVQFLQGETLFPARLLSTFDLPAKGDPLRAVAVAPPNLDPDKDVWVVVDMVDTKGNAAFLLSSDQVSFSEGR